jgi:iron(III) transport system substrate-binding protein
MGRISSSFFCVFRIVTIAFFLSLPCCKKDGPLAGGEVVLYCSVDQAIAEPVIAEFERDSGIKVLARYDTEATKTVGLVQKIRAEAAAPVADVFWSGEIFHTIRLANEGLLAPYSSERTKGWPERFADPNGQWYGFGLRARVIAYNTRRVDANDAPRCLEDVLDKKWKGRLVMASPEFGTTGGDMASWFAHYGTTRAREILKGLADNQVRLVSGNSTAVRMVATGQADVCFTDTDDVYAARRNGWPVAMNYLDQGGDGALAIPNTAAFIKRAAHPEQAARLMDFLLSERLEEILVLSDSHNCPVRVSVAQQHEAYIIAKQLFIKYEDVAGQLRTAIEAARETLR